MTIRLLSDVLGEPAVSPPSLARAAGPSTFVSLCRAIGPSGGTAPSFLRGSLPPLPPPSRLPRSSVPPSRLSLTSAPALRLSRKSAPTSRPPRSGAPGPAPRSLPPRSR